MVLISDCITFQNLTGHIDGEMSCIILSTESCFSPIGEIFRSRLRQFPSFVTCCTIDWFSEWPEEALRSVATNFIQDIPEVDNSDIIPGLVNICVTIHQSVARKSEQFLAELSRYNYVTPTSYLEILSLFAKMCHTKKTEISGQRNRTRTGLDKVSGSKP